MHAIAHVWKSEDSFVELVLSTFKWVLGIAFRSGHQAYMTSAFTQRTISLAADLIFFTVN